MKNETRCANETHKKRQFSYDKVDSYHQKFIDKNTGLIDEKYLEQRDCPVCNSDDCDSLFHKSGGRYVRCNSCSMIYINPVFSDSELSEYYKNLDGGQAQIIEEDKEFYTEIYMKGLDLASKHVKAGILLDLGCSSGFFLDIAKEKGWSTKGIEIGLAEAKLCEKRGHVVFTKPIEDMNFKKKFDLITLWDVFEHIKHSEKYLRILSESISDDGAIFLQIPNSYSLAARIMKEECNMFDGFEHVSLFNPETIKKIAEKVGLTIVDMNSVISERSVLNNFLNYHDPYFGKLPNKEKIFGFISDDIIHQNLLGYKMHVVLKKKK
jgi:SAM-dependent methyltransferase